MDALEDRANEALPEFFMTAAKHAALPQGGHCPHKRRHMASLKAGCPIAGEVWTRLGAIIKGAKDTAKRKNSGSNNTGLERKAKRRASRPSVQCEPSQGSSMLVAISRLPLATINRCASCSAGPYFDTSCFNRLVRPIGPCQQPDGYLRRV